MKYEFIAISRVRNESHIIGDVLEHVSKLVDGIIILDDASTDNTVDICWKFPKVLKVFEVKSWAPNPRARLRLEGQHRQLLYQAALPYSPKWIYVFDADEFAYFDGINLHNSPYDAYSLRLWDFYITPEDAELDWRHRTKIGPEFRDIKMIFRPHPDIYFSSRVPKLPPHYKIKRAGAVKHYGKAISIEEWNKTCEYYIHHHAEKGISIKWKQRLGKAVHTKSDFGGMLVSWENRNKFGTLLEDL